MAEIIFNKQIEKHNQAEISSYLNKYSFLIPSWCAEVIVNLYNSADGDDAAIRTAIRYEYRRATMDFYSSWLNQSANDKALHVIHDLLHIPTSVYVDFAEDKISRLCSDETFRKSLMEDSRMYCESMVQDLAKSILSKVNGQTS